MEARHVHSNMILINVNPLMQKYRICTSQTTISQEEKQFGKRIATSVLIADKICVPVA